MKTTNPVRNLRRGTSRASLIALCLCTVAALALTAGCGPKEDASDTAGAAGASAAAGGAASGTPAGPGADGKYNAPPTTGQTTTAPQPVSPAATQMGGQ